MFEVMGSSLLDVFAWPTLGYLLMGVALGFVVGILPGLGATGAMALMLPFTLTMTPAQALVFLLSMYAVTTIAGDITSIVFGIPGEPTTIALVVDGFPLTKQGQAGRALGAALVSSLLGALLGAVLLLLSIPVVRPLIGLFGSPEYFMLAMLGLAFLASVSGSAPFRGLMAGALGLLLATVGTDPQLGTQRFTANTPELWDGLPIVAVALGLYAIPEIVSLILSGGSIVRSGAPRLTGIRDGVADVREHKGLVWRSGAIGSAIGVVPGLGGIVAQWVAYGYASRRAGRSGRFGSGDIRGVIAPASASNSKESGNLLALVAFGLPSQATMAILLGALLIQGLVPGKSMLDENLDVTYTMIWASLIASIIAFALCLALVRWLVRAADIDGSVMVPVLLCLVLIGGFAEEASMFDLYVTVAFGLLGVLMVRFDIPRPPLILGLIIGPIAERNLVISLQAYGMEWVQRPAVIVLAVLITSGLAMGFSRKIRRRRSASSEVTV